MGIRVQKWDPNLIKIGIQNRDPKWSKIGIQKWSKIGTQKWQPKSRDPTKHEIKCGYQGVKKALDFFFLGTGMESSELSLLGGGTSETKLKEKTVSRKIGRINTGGSRGLGLELYGWKLLYDYFI